MDELLRELIEFLQNASPMVWETLRRQVYVHVAQFSFWFVLFGAAMISCVAVVRKHVKAKEEDNDRFSDHDIPIMMGVIGSALCGMLAAWNLVSAISRLINPDYYAIQLILENLR